MRTFVGIEIGGTKLQVVVGSEDAAILERFRFTVDAVEGAKGIKKQLRAALNKTHLHSVAAIGIGFGGPVDHTKGRIITSYQVDGWGGFVLQDWLERETGIPVWIDNDANIAALGESLHGAGIDFRKVFYTTMGSGVGAGFVMDQHVYHGAKVTEAEFGHIRIDKSGRTVESSCSGWAVDQKIRAYVASDSTSILSEFTRDYSRGEARALPAALKAGDQAAMQIVDETADDFAFALSHAVHLLNPDTVILGGGLSLVGEPLRIEIERKLTGYLMDVLRPGPLIQLSALKEDAVPIGALCLAIHKLKS
jgi:glucokinase